MHSNMHPSQSSDERAPRILTDIESTADARAFVVSAEQGPEFCSWCLTRKRIAYPEYDEAVAEQLSVGDTKQLFEALGHRLAPDGSVEAAQWIVNPVPDADVEHTPSGGKTVFCPGCDRANGRATGTTRSHSERHSHIDNFLDGLGSALDRDAAHEAISKANQNCALDDQDVFARALVAALSE